MKQLYLYLVGLLCAVAVHAEQEFVPDPPDPGKNNQATVTASASATKQGTVQFHFNNTVANDEQTDSVLIIFDRYNRTGAGVIYKVFAADKDHSVTIPAVPEGKYYVTIQCLGLHRDRVEKVVSIKSKKHENVRINLRQIEIFSKDKVVIPAYRPSFDDMAVLKTK